MKIEFNQDLWNATKKWLEEKIIALKCVCYKEE